MSDLLKWTYAEKKDLQQQSINIAFVDPFRCLSKNLVTSIFLDAKAGFWNCRIFPSAFKHMGRKVQRNIRPPNSLYVLHIHLRRLWILLMVHGQWLIKPNYISIYFCSMQVKNPEKHGPGPKSHARQCLAAAATQLWKRSLLDCLDQWHPRALPIFFPCKHMKSAN